MCIILIWEVGILGTSGPDGELLGLDRDPQALILAAGRLEVYAGRFHLRNASFAAMTQEAEALGWDGVDGILFDLGLSSMQLDDPARGFSFRFEGPLDMRFDPSQALTAGEPFYHHDEAAPGDAPRQESAEPRARD